MISSRDLRAGRCLSVDADGPETTCTRSRACKCTCSARRAASPRSDRKFEPIGTRKSRGARVKLAFITFYGGAKHGGVSDSELWKIVARNRLVQSRPARFVCQFSRALCSRWAAREHSNRSVPTFFELFPVITTDSE